MRWSSVKARVEQSFSPLRLLLWLTRMAWLWPNRRSGCTLEVTASAATGYRMTPSGTHFVAGPGASIAGSVKKTGVFARTRTRDSCIGPRVITSIARIRTLEIFTSTWVLNVQSAEVFLLTHSAQRTLAQDSALWLMQVESIGVSLSCGQQFASV